MSIVLGALIVLGAIKNGQDSDTDVEPTVAILLGILGVACIAGGVYLRKRATQTGDTFKRSLAMSPLIVLVLLFAMGGIAMATRSSSPSSPPTDAYGFTAAEHGAFVDGCGHGQRCECLWNELERSVTPDQMHDAERRYMSTGTWPPDFEAAMKSAATFCL